MILKGAAKISVVEQTFVRHEREASASSGGN
jgi:hypothetical protein